MLDEIVLAIPPAYAAPSVFATIQRNLVGLTRFAIERSVTIEVRRKSGSTGEIVMSEEALCARANTSDELNLRTTFQRSMNELGLSPAGACGTLSLVAVDPVVKGGATPKRSVPHRTREVTPQRGALLLKRDSNEGDLILLPFGLVSRDPVGGGIRRRIEADQDRQSRRRAAMSLAAFALAAYVVAALAVAAHAVAALAFVTVLPAPILYAAFEGAMSGTIAASAAVACLAWLFFEFASRLRQRPIRPLLPDSSLAVISAVPSAAERGPGERPPPAGTALSNQLA